MLNLLFWWNKTPSPKKAKKVCQHCQSTDCSEVIECHYCGNSIDFLSRMVMVQARCSNCRETQFFHNSCHDEISRMQPCCHGKYVGHGSGHTINLHDRGHCALCKLATEFWGKWHCSPGVVELNAKQLFERRTLHLGNETQTGAAPRWIN